jgi:hypothetical protein
MVLVIGWTAALLIGTARSSDAASPQPLTACSDEELTGKSYYLTADLDCGGGNLGVWLRRGGATLDLAGFSIRNAQKAVHCSRRCTILGPGTISDTQTGVEGYVVKIVNLTLRDIVRNALRVLKKLVVEGSLIENNGAGIRAPLRSLIVNSQITGNRTDGIRGFGVRYFDGGAQECADRKVELVNSTVTGNATGPIGGNECELGDFSACADIRTCNRAPILDGTSSCGTSLSVESGTPWGICTLD